MSGRWPATRRSTSLHARRVTLAPRSSPSTHPVTAGRPGGRSPRWPSGWRRIWSSSGPRCRWWRASADAVRAAGHRVLRPDGAAAAHDRGLQGFRQGGHGRRRRADRARPGPARRPAEADAPSTSSGRRTWSRTTGSPRARACWSPSDGAAARRTPRGPRRRVVIEEFLDGPEVSLFALCDGRPRPAAAGPGLQAGRATATRARTPAGWAPTRRCPGPRPAWPTRSWPRSSSPRSTTMAPARHPVQRPALRGPGPDPPGSAVIEFNARFGDPETQVVLARLETPLAGLLHAAADRRPGRGGPSRPAALAARARPSPWWSPPTGYPAAPREPATPSPAWSSRAQVRGRARAARGHGPRRATAYFAPTEAGC